MARQAEILESLVDLLLAPMRKRIDLDAATGDLGDRQGGATGSLVALAAGDPGIELAQCLAERNDLAQMAAAVGLLRPQIALRILARQVGWVGLQRARVGETEAVDQDIAIGEGLEEVLAGLEEQDRRRLIDLRHQMQQDRGLGAEGRDDRDAPLESELGRLGYDAI